MAQTREKRERNNKGGRAALQGRESDLSEAQAVKLLYAPSPHAGMARLRRLLHHPLILVHGPSTRASLARPRALSISNPRSSLDHDVGRHRRANRSLASRYDLFDSMDVGPGRPPFFPRLLPLFPFGSTL